MRGTHRLSERLWVLRAGQDRAGRGAPLRAAFPLLSLWALEGRGQGRHPQVRQGQGGQAGGGDGGGPALEGALGGAGGCDCPAS